MSLLDFMLDQRAEEAFSSATTAVPSQQGSSNPAVRQALRRGGKPAGNAKRSPSGAGYDDSKHPRGARGTHSGGKFVSKSGGSSEEVRTVQHEVGASTDGKFGDKTKQAVMDFQRAHGLKVDGIVGHQTAVALAGGDGKKATPGTLKGSDRSKLSRLRARQKRGRSRSRGGVVV